jgi:SNF2 family DNA or RNA helicase
VGKDAMEYIIQPWEHQLQAIERAEKLPNFALFFEMGTGKTSTAINILRHKINRQKRLLRILVICPPIVCQNWKEEFQKYSKIPMSSIAVLLGSQAARVKLAEKKGFCALSPNEKKLPAPHIFITNYESLSMDKLFDKFLLWQPEVVIFDESQRLKSITSKRSKQADRLVNTLKPRPNTLILSGSPIINSTLDIFQQFKILDGGETFGSNFYGFRGRYFRDKNASMPRQRYFPNWQILEGALEEIGQKLEAKSMRVLKKDCLDLPPFVQQTIKVEMSPEQKALYKMMLEDFVAFWKNESGKEQTASATLAITKGLRLMQIASGYVKTVEGNEVTIGAGFNPKQEALKELLEDLAPNHKVIVWACWRQNYEQIKAVCEKLSIEYVELHGDVSSTNKFKGVEEFNNNPKIRVLIGHPGSAGLGINLVSSDYSIFYSRTFSLEHSIQAEARNYRGGSEIHDKVTRIDLVSQDSIEENIVKKLASKEEIGHKVLREITFELARETCQK